MSVFAVVDVICYCTLIRRSWHEAVFSAAVVLGITADAGALLVLAVIAPLAVVAFVAFVADFFDCALPRAVTLCWFRRAGGISDADGLFGYFSVFMSETCSLHV